jgi:hypothetical protein
VTGGRSPRRLVDSGGAPQAVPAQARAETAAERIRREAQGPPCSCVRPGELIGDGRCARCFGRPGGDPVTKKPVVVEMSLRDLLGDQLALELHPDAPAGETQTELGDLNVEAADEEASGCSRRSWRRRRSPGRAAAAAPYCSTTTRSGTAAAAAAR